VAERLGNTPAIARSSYVHPAVVEGYLDGTLRPAMAAPPPPEIASGRLRGEEKAVLGFLRARAQAEASRVRQPA